MKNVRRVAWEMTPEWHRNSKRYMTYTGKKHRAGYSCITGRKGNFFWKRPWHRH
jgi:hypothetical protein